MATISVVTRPKPGQGGTLPLYVRIAHRDRTAYVSLELRIKPAHWNKSSSRVRKGHPHHVELNAQIARALSTAEGILASDRGAGRLVSAPRIAGQLRERLRGDEQEEASDFFDFAAGYVEGYEKRGQTSTYEVYRVSVRKFAAFYQRHAGRHDLPFASLSASGGGVTLLRTYYDYLIGELGNAINTAHKNMKHLRAIIRQAIREGLMTQNENPFFQITLRTEKRPKGFITAEEFRAAEALVVDHSTPLGVSLDMFLFAFYAGGLGFSDVAGLQGTHIQKEGNKYRLLFTRKKVDGVSGNLLVGKALAILDRYGGAGALAGRPGYVFPPLQQRKTATARQLWRSTSSANAVANKHLKEIQRMAGIQRSLHFHLGRHSLAKLLDDLGWSIRDISNILGHKTIRQTEIYLEGFRSPRLDDQLGEAFDRLAEPGE